MDQIKFGKFLSTLRNERHLTQEQLAEKLNIGSKTISKWECGNSIPDFETIIQLSKEFKVSLYELSIGERIKKKNIKKEDILKLVDKNQLRMISIKKKILLAISTLIGIILILSLIFSLTNFGTTKVYEIQSANSDFKIIGTFTKTNKYSTLAITNVHYVGGDNKFNNIKINNFDFELTNNLERIILVDKIKLDSNNNKTFNIDNMLLRINFLLNGEKHNINTIDDNNLITIKITYFDMDEYEKTLTIDLKLIEKYSNDKIW